MRILFVFAAIVLLAGCGHQVNLQADRLSPEQQVTIKMDNGSTVRGVVSRIEAESIVITDANSRSWRAPISAIRTITGPKPVYDGSGALIGERDIQAVQGSQSAVTFALSGGLLSVGTSFFLSSMASRAADEESRDPIIISGTAAGGLLGGYLFYRLGARKDRARAIELIREQRQGRYDSKILEERRRTEEIQKEIESLKKQIKE